MCMDNWVLVGQGKLEKQNQQRYTVGATQVKVRVTYVMLTNYDALCYTGEKKLNYPVTIGRTAVGVITELGEHCYGLKVGSRVYLNAVRPCGGCYSCKSGNRADCTSPLVVVKDFDGFLRDFVVCEYTDVTLLPDVVDDVTALCIEWVALAENIFDRLNLSTGSRVAIIGVSFFGSILAQVALYHKLVPIVIDNYPKNIDRMKRSGVSFSFAADENLLDNINNATSGSLCDAAIYTSDCKLPASVPARVLARNKDLVLGGVSPVNFSLDSGPLFEKNLRIYSVSDGFGYTETAVNMIMHGAIDLTNFEKDTLREFDLDTLLTERAANISRNPKMTILKLIL